MSHTATRICFSMELELLNKREVEWFRAMMNASDTNDAHHWTDDFASGKVTPKTASAKWWDKQFDEEMNPKLSHVLVESANSTIQFWNDEETADIVTFANLLQQFLQDCRNRKNDILHFTWRKEGFPLVFNSYGGGAIIITKCMIEYHDCWAWFEDRKKEIAAILGDHWK